jgi:hypothetical protein
MMMQMVGSFAEFERAMIRERTSAGIVTARAEGRVGGRLKPLDPRQQKGRGCPGLLLSACRQGRYRSPTVLRFRLLAVLSYGPW